MLNHTILTALIGFQGAVAARSDRMRSNEGATTVEYVMILGIMALLVAAIFLIPGTGLRDQIERLGDAVKNTIADVTNG